MLPGFLQNALGSNFNFANVVNSTGKKQLTRNDGLNQFETPDKGSTIFRSIPAVAPPIKPLDMLTHKSPTRYSQKIATKYIVPKPTTPTLKLRRNDASPFSKPKLITNRRYDGNKHQNQKLRISLNQSPHKGGTDMRK